MIVVLFLFIYMQLYVLIFNHEEIEMARFRVIKCFGLGLNHILGVEERVVLWLCFAKCNSLIQNHSYLNLVSVRLWGGTLSVCWIELHPLPVGYFSGVHLMSRDSMTGRFPWESTLLLDVSSTWLRIHESAYSCMYMYIQLQAGGILVQVVSWWSIWFWPT